MSAKASLAGTCSCVVYTQPRQLQKMPTWTCFVKWLHLDPIIALILYYPVLNLVHTTSDPKGTYMKRCIKSHLYPVASFGMCNCQHCICVFRSLLSLYYCTVYVYCHVNCLHVRLIHVISKDQSINQICKNKFDNNTVSGVAPLKREHSTNKRMNLYRALKGRHLINCTQNQEQKR